MTFIRAMEVYGDGDWSRDSPRVAHCRVVAHFAYKGIDEALIRQYTHFDIHGIGGSHYVFSGVDGDGNKVEVFATDVAGYYGMRDFILECGITVTSTSDFTDEVFKFTPSPQQPIIAEWLTNAHG